MPSKIFRKQYYALKNNANSLAEAWLEKSTCRLGNWADFRLRCRTSICLAYTVIFGGFLELRLLLGSPASWSFTINRLCTQNADKAILVCCSRFMMTPSPRQGILFLSTLSSMIFIYIFCREIQSDKEGLILISLFTFILSSFVYCCNIMLKWEYCHFNSHLSNNAKFCIVFKNVKTKIF